MSRVPYEPFPQPEPQQEPELTHELEAAQEREPEPEPATDPAPAPAPVVRPRVVALLNQKGGVGKTTSTVNLGAALARYGQRVLLIDLDPQSNLSLHFGVEPRADQPSVHELLMDDQVRIEDVVVNARARLDFIPAVTELALVEGELAQRPDMQHVLRTKLEPVFGQYDIVLLDCPPSLGVLSVNALTVADEVFVPMQAHYLPLRGLEKLLQTVHMVSQGLNPNIRVTGVLLCMHEGLSSHARAVIAEIESQLTQFRGTDLPWANARVLEPAVRRNIKLAEAPSFGQTIFDYAPRCPGAEDYRRVAESLLRDWGIEPPAFDGVQPRAARAPQPRRAARAHERTPPVRAAGRGKTPAAGTGATARAAGKTAKVRTVRASAKVGTAGKPGKAGKTGTVRGATKPGTRGKLAKPIKPGKQAKPVKAGKPSKTGTSAKPRAHGTPARKSGAAARQSPRAAPRTAAGRSSARTPQRGTARRPARRATSRAIRSGGLSL